MTITTAQTAPFFFRPVLPVLGGSVDHVASFVARIKQRLQGGGSVNASSGTLLRWDIDPAFEARVEPVLTELLQLEDLENDWDAQGAAPIHPTALNVAAQLILEAGLRFKDLRSPAVVPCSNSGVALEWHPRNFEVDVSITPGGRVTVYFERFEPHDEWEVDATSDWSHIYTALPTLGLCLRAG